MAIGLRTAVCERLGIELPIFGFSHVPAVAAAICEAGGFGVFGVAREDPEEIGERIAQLRDRVGNRPFGVDLMLPPGVPERADPAEIDRRIPAPHREFVEALRDKYAVPPASKPTFFTRFVRSKELFARQVEAVLGSDANLVATAIGLPPEVIARCKRAGKTTLALIGSPRHARAALGAGADVLVAQGYDAGGHTGTIGTMSLVPQIVDLAQPAGVPVLAAGGIATGRQIAASLALGAQGAWMGTVWLGAVENRTHPLVLKKLLAAGSEDTVITRAHSGKPCRVLRSAWSDEWQAAGAPEPLPMPYQQALTGELMAAVEEHGIEPLMYEPAGQSVRWVERAETVAQIVDRLVNETRQALERVGSLRAPGTAPI
ncbi:MAG TPA: nitronate monooxygenase [Burkholderiaceae bacterium]|nr:nitronate monooxygenase [Burkholderiaceae bacterium]